MLKCVIGIRKNCLIETVLLSTQLALIEKKENYFLTRMGSINGGPLQISALTLNTA